MTKPQAHKILYQFQKWRKDDQWPSEIQMPDPKDISKAIDVALKTLKQ